MKNLPLLIGSLLLTFIAVVGVSVMFTKKVNAPVVAVDQRLLVSDTPHVKGPTDAKVTVVEFSDFQCPACLSVEPLIQQLQKKYEGKIRFVYRLFPLRSIHLNSDIAARASEAAEKQGAFWAYHDKLFDTQDAWAGEKDPTSKFIEYARDLKLNADQFKKDLSDPSSEARVVADERDGNTIGVDATPTFFVNGYKTEANALDSAIQAGLQQ
jgi:protein-disulfide isomerase